MRHRNDRAYYVQGFDADGNGTIKVTSPTLALARKSAKETVRLGGHAHIAGIYRRERDKHVEDWCWTGPVTIGKRGSLGGRA